MLEGVYLWESGGFSKPVGEPQEVRLLVAESWLVEDGYAIALAQHFARFQASCHMQAGGSVPEIPSFWAQLRRLIPTEGRWFPRAEMRLVEGRLQLALRLRLAPAPSAAVQLLLSAAPDPRHYPKIKGPDIDLLESWRRAAVAQGANEATLVSATGVVLEGLTTSLVWWDNETLCFPAEESLTLPSITRHVVGVIAQARNIPLAHRPLVQEQMHHAPVWALNALHGIRPVVQLVGPNQSMPQHPALSLWQHYYQQQRQTIK